MPCGMCHITPLPWWFLREVDVLVHVEHKTVWLPTNASVSSSVGFLSGRWCRGAGGAGGSCGAWYPGCAGAAGGVGGCTSCSCSIVGRQLERNRALLVPQ